MITRNKFLTLSLLRALRLLLQCLVFQACVLYGSLWVIMRPLSMLRVCAMYARSMLKGSVALQILLGTNILSIHSCPTPERRSGALTSQLRILPQVLCAKYAR